MQNGNTFVWCFMKQLQYLQIICNTLLFGNLLEVNCIVTNAASMYVFHLQVALSLMFLCRHPLQLSHILSLIILLCFVANI